MTHEECDLGSHSYLEWKEVKAFRRSTMKRGKEKRTTARPDELLYKFPRTRGSGAVTCLAFGKDRKERYPGYFFCNACDLFENAILHGNKRAKRTQQNKYACTGGHTDRDHPTRLLQTTYRGPNRAAGGYNSEDDSSREVLTKNKRGAAMKTSCSSQEAKTPPPSESPVKKRIRRTSARCSTIKKGDVLLETPLRSKWRPCYEEEEGSDVSIQADRAYNIDEDEVNQKFASTLSFVDNGETVVGDSGNSRGAEKQAEKGFATSDNSDDEFVDSATSDNSDDEFVDSTSDNSDDEFVDSAAGEKNCHAVLIKYVHDLEKEIEILKAKIAELNAKLLASSSLCTFDSPAGADSMGSMVGSTNELNENNYERKRRINKENETVSKALSGVIHNFVMTSDLTANKRRFNRRRLAGIVVESVFALEWLRSELAELSTNSKQTAPRRKKCTISDRLNRAVSVINDNNEQVEQSLTGALTSLMNRRLRRCTHKRKATVIVECIWDEGFLAGEAQSAMVNQVRKYFRNHVFTPAKILKEMDLAGFNLSLSGIEVLRRIDCDNKYSRGFLPSKSSILRAARKVESHAGDLCPFTMIGRAYSDNDDNPNDEDFGEGFEFDIYKTTRTLFEAFGLMEDAKQRSVELGLASDGAQLTHTLSHVAAGLKFNDMGMRNPFTKQPLLLHEPDSLVQSRNLCFPLRVVIAKDSKKTLDGFRFLYNEFSGGNVSTALQCRPLKMSYPGDMKLQWGALDRGGAAKVKEQFCYVCPCTSSSLHIPNNASDCNICKDKEPQPNVCYHYKFVASPEEQEHLHDELAVVSALVNGAYNAAGGEARPQQGRRMYVRKEGHVAVEGDSYDIDYQPTSAIEMAAFSRRVTDELASRSLNVTGPLASRQQRLRQQLKTERRLEELQHMLMHSEPRDKAMYLVLQAVVCILHLENRVGLKSIESILRSGLSLALQGTLTWTSSNSLKKRQDEYVKCITDIMQTRILGTPTAPSQWRFPLTEDGKMGALSMDNNRTRATMNQIELLIDVSFPDDNPNKAILMACFPRYRAALVILRKNTDYTNEEIFAFQEHVDAWFCKWVQVYGKEGCTNYTHMLSSSHIMRYMQEWRCLHRYSQQGWEALNALLKAYFFRRTNRGGLAKNSARKSKLLGIARWLQRRMMWYSGNGDALFNTNYDEDAENVGEDGGSISDILENEDSSLVDSDNMSIVTSSSSDEESESNN